MRLTKRARDGIWLLSYTVDGKQVRVSTGCRERAQADVMAQRLLTGTGDNPLSYTVGEALDRAWSRRWEGLKAAHQMKYIVKSVRARFGKYDCNDITYQLLDDYVEELEHSGLAPSTIKHHLSCIHVTLTEAAKRGKIKAAPPMPVVKIKNARVRWLSLDEEVTLMAHVRKHPQGEMMAYLVITLIDTGARLSEITCLDRRDVTEQGITLHDTKNGGTRRVPLTVRARSALGGLFNTPLWVDITRDVRALAVRRASAKDFLVKRFTEIRNSAGMADVSLHVLRHTCASRLVQAGVDLYRVKTWLGHSSITMTERYAHLAPSALADAAMLLEPKPKAEVIDLNERRNA